MHTVKETDMIAAKLDLLKHRENYAQAMNSHSLCEVCGNDGHSGNDCPETREDCANLSNNNGIVHNKEARGGTSCVHYSRKVTITTLLGQAKINKNINKKLLARQF